MLERSKFAWIALAIIVFVSLNRAAEDRPSKHFVVKHFADCGRINIVRKASQFASIALSIVVVALPLLACLTSFAEMSPAQRECCEKMAGRCEMSVMPSSHSCCQHPVSPHTATASRMQSSDFGLAITMVSEVPSHFARPMIGIAVGTFESPPESPPQSISILRI